MFENYPILCLITFIPLAGAFLLIFMTRVSNADAQEQLSKNAPRVALVISSAVFFLALMLTFDFDSSKSGFQFVETTKWLGGGIDFRLGVDGISILFVLLTTFLTPLCILASERSSSISNVRVYGGFLNFRDLNDWYLCCLRFNSFLSFL